MLSVALSLVAATIWGGSDFSAGIASRRVGALLTSCYTFLGASLVLLVAVPLFGSDWSGAAVLAGLVAALCATVGFVAFYAALALAPIGVVTAIVAACEVIVPVLLAVVWKGEHLAPIAWIGVAAAGIGAVVVGASEGGLNGAGLRAVLLALVGGVSFGLSVVALDVAPESSGFLAVGVEMLGGLVLVAMLILAARALPRVRRVLEPLALFAPVNVSTSHVGISGSSVVIDEQDAPGVRSERARYLGAPSLGVLGLGLLAGALQAAANIVLMLALWSGQLAVVGAISALYPVSAALLAWAILKERLSLPLITGIAIALFGCVLLGLA